MRTLPYAERGVTEKIIILNLVVMIITAISPRMTYYLSMIPSFVLHGYLYQFFTYMFVHGSISHILFNMLSLYIFGKVVERVLGSWEFLLFYLVIGVLDGVFSFICYLLMNQNVILMGASGALYGVLLLFAVFFPYAKIYIFGILPVQAPLLILIYLVIELYSEVFSVAGGIAHLTHLGGLLFAFLYCVIRLKIDPVKVFKNSLRR